MPTLTWIAGLSGVIAINDGCALGDDGRVKCWGSNREGALGADVTGDCSGPWNAPCSDQPVAVVGVTEAIALSSGWEHSCALIADGTVKCWGTNFYGQLGLLATQTDNCGYWSCSRTATVVPGLSDVQAIAAGFGYTCALNQDGQVLCLGKVNTGPIPLQEFAPPEASIATEVQLSDPVKLIGTGRDVMCAATVNDELYCWGRNEEGELGTGDRDPHDDPVRVRLCQ
jgi:alpha-tubulin suppressor-like RCC1 family protein